MKLPPKMNEFLQKTFRLDFYADVLRSSGILTSIDQNRIQRRENFHRVAHGIIPVAILQQLSFFIEERTL